MERQLDEATRQIEELVGIVESVRAEVSRLKGEQLGSGETGSLQPAVISPSGSASGQREPDDPTTNFVEHIIEPELVGDERDARLTARPEIFTQTRYSAAPVRNTGLCWWSPLFDK